MNIRPSRRHAPKLDLTPLIDVVFLLLIFFMVSTTFDKQTNLKVDLPDAVTQNTKDKDEKQLVVTINRKGEYAVNDKMLVRHDLATLKAALLKFSEGDNSLPIIIKGDRQAPYQATITLLDAASQLDMARLSFIAQQQAK